MNIGTEKSKGQTALARLLVITAIILLINRIAQSYFQDIVFPLIEALYLLASLFIYGFILMSMFRRKTEETDSVTPLSLTTHMALGLIVTTFFFFVAAMLKMLTSAVIIGFYTVPLLLLFVIIKNQPLKQSAVSVLQSFFNRPKIEYLVFIFPLLYAALPPSFYDSLAYHLGIPNLYLQNLGFIPTPQLFYANTFIYYEISLIPAVFAGDLVPSLFHFFMGTVIILSIIDFAVLYFHITKRWVLLLTIVSMPMTIFLLTAVKNDLISPLFILLGIHFYLKDQKYLSALFWGFSLGVKYTNIIPLAVFLLLTIIKSKRARTLKPVELIKQLIVFGIIIVVLLLPLMIKNYMFTGNPVFPFFHKYFHNKIQYWDSTRVSMLEHDAKKLFFSFKDVLKFPFSISFKELGSGGIVGPLFLIFLPFLFIKKEKRLLLLLFALLSLLIGANFKLSTRVWFIAFLMLSIYVTIAYEYVSHKLMTVIFFIIIGFNVLTAFGLHEYLYLSYNLYSGKMNAREYKEMAFPTVKAFDFANETLPANAKTLVVGEGKSFYLKRPYDVSSGYDYSILRKYLEKSVTPTDFIVALKNDKIDYIIFNLFEFDRLQQQYKCLSENDFKKALAFLKTLPPVFKEEKNGIYVLEIK
ncbi:MAG: hypothetical protein ACM3SY_16980 [Candidatus Omnitrophota bacterium]